MTCPHLQTLCPSSCAEYLGHSPRCADLWGYFRYVRVQVNRFRVNARINRGDAMGKEAKTISRDELIELKAKLSELPPANPHSPEYVPKFVWPRGNAYSIPPYEFDMPLDETDAAERAERDKAIKELYWERRKAWIERRKAELRRLDQDEGAQKEFAAELEVRFGDPELTIAAAIQSDTRAQEKWCTWDERDFRFQPVFRAEDSQ